ncbi:MAG: type IV pilus modification PilV family protein [Planctomycetota bacterium]|jgi:hypothetical protein
MKCRFKKIQLSAFRKIASNNSAEQTEKKRLKATHYTLHTKPAFSLVETVTALIILALISSSVLVVINRCMASAADSALRMQALEVSRENVETLLSKGSVSEMVEYGSSDKYPEIQWQTTVETFYEPATSRIWIQAVCSAEYTDSAGELQTVELTHWLTDLTKEQLIQIIEERQKDLTAEQIIETKEEAADYADVDVETIDLWKNNGMLTTNDGYYIKNELDLYKQTDGKPTAEDRNRLAKEDIDLEEAADYADVDVETIELWKNNGMLTTNDGYYIKSELDLYKQTNGKPTAEDRNRMAKDEKDKKDEPDKPVRPDEQDYREAIMQMSVDELYQLLLNSEKF